MGVLKFMGALVLGALGLFFAAAVISVMIDRSNGKTGNYDEDRIQAQCQTTVDDSAPGNERRMARRMCDLMKERAAASAHNK